MQAMRAAWAATVIALAACGAGTGGGGDRDARDGDRDAGGDGPVVDVDAPAAGCTETIGELSRPIEVRPIYVDHRSDVQPIAAGGAVELIAPPQAGFVLLVGLEAKNLRGCVATITGRLSDPATGAILAEDERATQLAIGADGWGRVLVPAIAMVANVNACPAAMLPRDVDGNHWRLDLVIVDEREARGAWSGDIVPFCRTDAPDPEACPCQCDSEYVFGQACPVDPP